MPLAFGILLHRQESKKPNNPLSRVAGLIYTIQKEKGISIVVVDRGGFKFHGRVKQIVEAATAAGLKISERAAEKAEEAK